VAHHLLLATTGRAALQRRLAERQLGPTDSWSEGMKVSGGFSAQTNCVAADVSPRTLIPKIICADSRHRLHLKLSAKTVQPLTKLMREELEKL